MTDDRWMLTFVGFWWRFLAGQEKVFYRKRKVVKEIFRQRTVMLTVKKKVFSVKLRSIYKEIMSQIATNL